MEKSEIQKLSDGGMLPGLAVLTTMLQQGIVAVKENYDTRLDAMDRAQTLFENNLTRVPTEIDKQIGHLQSLMEEKFVSLRELVADKNATVIERLNGMDKAVVLLQDIADRVMSLVDEKIKTLELVTQEKFASTQNQFKELNERAMQVAKSAKEALDAALQAAEKASLKQTETFTASIAKSEGATSKQIDQQGLIIQKSTDALNDKVGLLEGRMTRAESAREGAAGLKTNQISVGMFALAGVGLVVTILLGMFAVYEGMKPSYPWVQQTTLPGVAVAPAAR